MSAVGEGPVPLAVKAEDLGNGALQPEHTIKQEAGAVKQEPLTATEEDSKPALAKAEPDAPMKAEIKAEPQVDVKEEAGVDTEEPGAQPSDEQLAVRLQALLQKADMSIVTERQLRKQLEQEFGCELSGRKAAIRAEITAYLTAQQEDAPEEAAAAEEDAEDENAGSKKRKRKSGGKGFGECLLSEPLAKFVGAERMGRSQVVKKIWEYIKQHNLQNPKNKRKIIVDDTLGTFLSKPVDMFSMNKQLSKHCFQKDKHVQEDDGGESEDEAASEDDSDEDGEAAPKAKKARARKSEGGERRKSGGFTAPLRCSEELSDWLGGQEQITRADLTKYFWNYVKSNGLQNPSNKQQILCDDKLKWIL